MDQSRLRTVTPVTDSSEDETSDTESQTLTKLEADASPQPAGNLSSLSFEEMISFQSKVGRKAFYKTVQSSRRGKLAANVTQLDKNRPLEISSKEAVPFLRKVVPAKKMMQRDPRFDDLSGEFKPGVFEKTYSFLDEVKKKEKEVLEKKLRKARDPALRDQLQQLLRRRNQQEEAAKQKQRLQERQAAFKRQQRERAQQGKKPFYLKKGDIRKLELADRYQELKKKGKVESFLSKKRKRNSMKDRRRLPSQQ
ncbi:ribosomal RNA processing, partial [Pristimantis euphronides]